MKPEGHFSCQSFETKKIVNFELNIIKELFSKRTKLLVTEDTKQDCSEHDTDEEDSS